MSETKGWAKLALLVLVGLTTVISYRGLGSAGEADRFPSREIVMVVQFAPGGNTDVNARLLAPYLQKGLGVPVVIENRPEAGGVKAITDVYKGKPDGHTLLHNVFPQNAQKEILFDTPFKILEFTYLAGFTQNDMFISVRKEAPFKNLKDLIEMSKKKSLNVSVSQLGSHGHLNAMILKKRVDVNLEVVPYPGEAPAATALLGGHVDMISSTDTTVWLQKERLRPLVVFSAKRSSRFPDVPTLKELGYDIVSFSQVGLSGPPGLPSGVVKILSEALAKAIRNPELVSKADKAGSTVVYTTGAEFQAEAKAAYKLINEEKEIFQERK
jgi:tripartite-type tricarboxylate transporter receptor subunit TctC